MRTLYAALLLTLSLFGLACGPGKAERLQQLREQRNALQENYSVASAEAFTQEATAFVREFPKDSACAPLLYNAAQLFMSLDQGDSALACIQALEDQYPQYPKMADARFVKALVYDALLNKKEAAAEAYQHFITQYPNHPEVPKAQTNLEALFTNLENIPKENPPTDSSQIF